MGVNTILIKKHSHLSLSMVLVNAQTNIKTIDKEITKKGVKIIFGLY